MSIEDLNRAYSGPDWYLLENSQTLHDLFVEDLPFFSAFDAELNVSFAEDWQDAIDAAINFVDDNTISAQIETQTEAVKTAMQNCRNTYNDIIYFAQKAFGKNSAMLQKFGRGNAYRLAFNSQGRMFGFMDELSQVAITHRAALEAKGCAPAVIDGIATVRDALGNLNRQQNIDIKDRPNISQGRVDAYNTVYEFTQLVIEAAQRVYRNNPAKLGQYQYNPPVNGSNSGSATFTLAPGEEKLIAEIPYNPARQLNFDNTGSTTLQFGLNTTATMPASGLITLVAGNSAGTNMGNMAPAGTFLMVKNTGATGGSGGAEWEE